MDWLDLMDVVCKCHINNTIMSTCLSPPLCISVRFVNCQNINVMLPHMFANQQLCLKIQITYNLGNHEGQINRNTYNC